jgi:N6-adenosine-specific RNA methylase IME4
VKARALIADPPWKFNDREAHRPGTYPRMDLEDIEAFPLPHLEDDAFLFLWKVAALTAEALIVMDAWGFRHVTEWVWDKRTKHGKQAFGMGHYTRASHETCIVGVRGAPKPMSRSERSLFHEEESVFSAALGIHSEKPEEFYQKVQRFTEGPYVELFARKRREGWETYGVDINRPHPGYAWCDRCLESYVNTGAFQPHTFSRKVA